MDSLGLSQLTVFQISVILTFSTVTILAAKTVFVDLVSQNIMVFLIKQRAELSVELARIFLSHSLVVIHKWTTSEATYSLGGGASAVTVSPLDFEIIIGSEVFLTSWGFHCCFVRRRSTHLDQLCLIYKWKSVHTCLSRLAAVVTPSC